MFFFVEGCFLLIIRFSNTWYLGMLIFVDNIVPKELNFDLARPICGYVPSAGLGLCYVK